MQESKRSKQKRGYTMMELVVIILILAIMAAVAIPTIGNLVTNSKVRASEREMMELVRAIVGEPDAGFLGFMSEIGDLPDTLDDLYSIGTNSPYNPFTRAGWNGPYIDMQKKDIDKDGAIGAAELDILFDAWGNAYRYDKTGGTISCNGPNQISGDGDDIVVPVE